MAQEKRKQQNNLSQWIVTDASGRLSLVSPTAQTRRGQNTRDSILDEALKIASKEGLAGLTIGRLADQVGMSKSGLFAHFKSKDSLQLSVLERARDLFTNKVLKPSYQERKGEPRVIAVFENWVKFLNDGDLPGGSIFVAAAFELDDKPGVLHDYVQSAQRDLLLSLEKTANIAIEVDDFSKDLDPAQFAWSFYSYVLGYHHSKRMVEDPNADKHLRAAFEALLSACRKQKKLTVKSKMNKNKQSKKE